MQKALLELEEQVKGSVTWVIKWLAYDWDLPQPETPNIIIIASPNYKELKKRGIEGATNLTENILGAKDLTGKALFEEFLEGNIDEFYKNIYFCNDVSTAKELYCKMIGFVKRTEFSQLFAHHIGDRLGQRLHQSLEAQTIQKQELKEAIFTKEYPLRQRLEKLRRLAKRN